MAIIEDKLVCPDGVRLMDRMAEYKAGKQTYFKRAELAANLGREVGLQYCHAHIRFIEALCKMGKAKEVYDNLYKILPVGIEKAVPNAEIRQSNAYFSSSDGKFNDRYEAYENFEKLKTGDVQVKGGWKIYSSGPGILHQSADQQRTGCSLPEQQPGSGPDCGAKSWVKVSLTFPSVRQAMSVDHQSGAGRVHTPKRASLNGTEVELTVLPNAYRTGAAMIEQSTLNSLLQESGNTLEILVISSLQAAYARQGV